MARALAALVIGLIVLGPVSPVRAQVHHQDQPPPGARYTGRAFTFQKVREDVYEAIGTGNLGVGSNAAVVINADDVLLVDSHVSPAAAWALLKELKAITRKPVRYVVNTHFHYDHVHGNQIYPPDVEIIGHEFTRAMVAAGKSIDNVAYQGSVRFAEMQVGNLTRAADSARSRAVKDSLTRQAAVWRDQQKAVAAVKPVPPNLTVSERMTLFRGGREIRIIFFGRGHTGGDVVVYLPRERIIMTGDLLVAERPFMGDGYLREWAETLEQIKALDFDLILPGHGEPFSDRGRIDQMQALLRDFWDQAVAAHAAGRPAEEAAKSMDLSAHDKNYPIPPAWTPEIVARQRLVGVRRIYDLLDAKAK
jgi:glyoxylase-like metal-dependent hydrolase (beta-lactamase superfamily II)